MQKVKIGIIQSFIIEDENNPYYQYYKQSSIYTHKIYEVGGIPLGIMLEQNTNNLESLDICDGFIIIGGNKIDRYIYKVIDYAIKNNKPLLGICMGAEAIDIYSWIKDAHLDEESYDETYERLKQLNEKQLLKRLEDENIHNNHFIDADKLYHPIRILDNSIAYKIYKKNELLVPSMHAFDFKYVGKDFNITGRAFDDVCEIIEYKDDNYFIMGVHYHPEIMDNNLIFEYLIKECEKRK